MQSVFAKRLKQARLAMSLSQDQVGVRAGIEEASSSARMNRYERGVRSPTYELVRRFAEVLNVPTTYFYAQDDDEAKLLLAFHKMSAENKKQYLKVAQVFFEHGIVSSK